MMEMEVDSGVQKERWNRKKRYQEIASEGQTETEKRADRNRDARIEWGKGLAGGVRYGMEILLCK